MPEPPGPISKLWWVVTVVAFLLAFGLGIGGCASFVGSNTQDDQSVSVPGRGVVTVEEAGDYRIRYESDRFLETGVCRSETRTGAGGSDNFSSTTVCDADQLADAGQPTLRQPGRDRFRLTRDSDGLVRFNDRITVDVWQVRIDEPGDYELEFADAPLGTQRLVFESQSVELGGAALVLLSVPVFIAALVLLIVSLLRASGRKRRRLQAAYPSAPPPGWGATGPVPPVPPPGWGPAPPAPPPPTYPPDPPPPTYPPSPPP